MICPKCGKALSETATLCTECGWKTERWKSAPVYVQRKNKDKCGSPVFFITCGVLVAISIAAFVIMCLVF